MGRVTCQGGDDTEDKVILSHSAVYHELLKLVISLREEGVYQLLLAEGYRLQDGPQHLLLGGGQVDS